MFFLLVDSELVTAGLKMTFILLVLNMFLFLIINYLSGELF